MKYPTRLLKILLKLKLKPNYNTDSVELCKCTINNLFHIMLSPPFLEIEISK